ncbi:MAG: HAD hydrolase-like protein [Oscillospiraceae bacterium]|jgi:phosphoglycolate phosphatase|nr:HAD hydrolase-like protein [Oscillospiraceae bacterium]
MPNYTHLIWDWNGTLLDDVNWCVACINKLLRSRSLAPLPDKAAYRRVFRFPIADYYRDVGFDFDRDPFPILAAEYIAAYHRGDAAHCALYPQALPTLRALAGLGVRQVILSATRQDNLLAQVGRYPVIPYLDEVLGIRDIYGASKVDAGRAYAARAGAGRMLLVGDTAHDCETARAIGADCALVAQGHQARETLAACGVPVLDDVGQVPGLLL